MRCCHQLPPLIRLHYIRSISVNVVTTCYFQHVIAWLARLLILLLEPEETWSCITGPRIILVKAKVQVFVWKWTGQGAQTCCLEVGNGSKTLKNCLESQHGFLRLQSCPESTVERGIHRHYQVKKTEGGRQLIKDGSIVALVNFFRYVFMALRKVQNPFPTRKSEPIVACQYLICWLGNQCEEWVWRYQSFVGWVRLIWWIRCRLFR